MQLRADFLVGTQSSNSWAGVYYFKPENSIEPLELFAIIKLETANNETRLEALAKMFLDELQNYLFEEGKEGDYNIRLENAVWKMKSKMETLLSSDERYAQNGLDIELGLALFEKNFLYLGVIGETKAFIKRGDRFADLSQGLTDGSMMGFLKTGSLELEEGDRLALSTSTANDIDSNIIQEAVNNLRIKALSPLASKQGAAVLLLADENDQWKTADSDPDEVLNEPLAGLAEPAEVAAQVEDGEGEYIDGSAGSAKYIPIQAEDFEAEDSIDALANVSAESAELDDVRIEDEEEINVRSLADVEADIPRGKLLMSRLRGGLTRSIAAGRSSLDNLRTQTGAQSARPVPIEVDFEDDDELRPSGQKRFSQFQEDQFEDEDVLQGSTSKFGAASGATADKLKTFSQTKVMPFLQKSNKTYIKYLRDIVIKIKDLIVHFLGWFKKEFIGGGVDDRRDMFAKARRRKRNRIILVILVIVLGVVIINSINNRNIQLQEEARIEQVRSNIDTYNSDLNSIIRRIPSATSDDQKTELVNQLDSLNNKFEAQKKEELFLDEIDSAQAKIQTNKDDILGIVGFSEPLVITDIGKLYSDANVTDMVFAAGGLYISDKGRNTIYQVGTQENSQINQIATNLSAPYTLTKNVAGDVIFFDTDSTSAVGKINLSGDGSVQRIPGLSQSVIGNVTKAAIFSGNDALYEIHQNHQQIFKRDKDADGYVGGGAVYNVQNPPNWKTDPELGSAIDITVPYEIYTLIRGKGLRRYLAGGENTITADSFVNTIQKDIDSISNATAIDIDGKLLAVADPNNRRVMLFTIEDSDAKNLIYNTSYIYRGSDSSIFKNIKEVVVNEASRAIYVLDGTTIIRLDI